MKVLKWKTLSDEETLGTFENFLLLLNRFKWINKEVVHANTNTFHASITSFINAELCS
jgi:hypothetical protein